MLEIVARGVDLNVSLSREIREMSLYVGGLFLAALGPIAAIVVARSIRLGSFDWLIETVFDPGRRLDVEGLGPFAAVAFTLGLVCVAAISFDVQLLAISLTAGRLRGRTIGLREAIGRARGAFWRLVFASVTTGLILVIPSRLVGRAIAGNSPEATLAISTLVDILLSAPFAYVGAAVVLARAGPFAAVLLSWRMARRRWRLALVIGIVNTAVSYLSVFAIGVGLDILTRIATALGIDRGIGPIQSVELVAIVGIAIVAIGSLVLTIAALTVAPQVVAWLGLGGSAEGVLDGPPGDPSTRPARPRLVSRPMEAAFLVSASAAVVSIVVTA